MYWQELKYSLPQFELCCVHRNWNSFIIPNPNSEQDKLIPSETEKEANEEVSVDDLEDYPNSTEIHPKDIILTCIKL